MLPYYHLLTVFLKPIFRQKLCSRGVANKIDINNMKPNLCIPNANYIPLARFVVPVGSVLFCIGSSMLRIGSARLFGCQHFGISSANSLRWGLYPTRSPNVNGFMFWWNIGLRIDTRGPPPY